MAHAAEKKRKLDNPHLSASNIRALQSKSINGWDDRRHRQELAQVLEILSDTRKEALKHLDSHQYRFSKEHLRIWNPRIEHHLIEYGYKVQECEHGWIQIEW